MHKLRAWFLTILLLHPLDAAELTGVVRFGGLPAPGVSVTATKDAKRIATVTDAEGRYRFPDVAEGNWNVEVGMQLFASQKREAATTAPAEWDLQLLPAEELAKAAVVSVERLEVAPPVAAPPKPNAKNAPAPTNTAAPFQRTALNATATTAEAPPADGLAGQDANELRQRAADGLLVNGSVNNGAASPFAQLQAFGNNRRGFRSLYNGNIGLITNSSFFDARQYSLTGQDTPKPAYSRLQGLVSFGGPIRIPKLMRQSSGTFTVNYQWTRNSNASTLSGLMPTANQRNGILADRVVAPTLISPQARALLGLYPLPNFTGSNRYNYQIPVVGGVHQDELQARANRGFGRRDQINGLVGWQNIRSDSTNLFGFLDTSRINGINTNVSWRHSFSVRMFTNVSAQYSRQTTRANPYFAGTRNISGAAGVTGNNQDPANWGPPALTFASGISSLGDVQSSFNRNQSAGFTMDLFYNRGRHNWTGGGGFRRNQANILAQQDPRGTFTFTGVDSGSDFANFLLGKPDVASIAFGNADKYLRFTNGEAWVSDDWRVNPSLTLNLGLRWEYWGPGNEKYGRLVNLDIAPGFVSAAPVINGSPLNADRNNLAPRLAFSWRPVAASSMVVRGGYGVYYDTSVYFPILSQMAQQFPLSKSLRVENSLLNPLTLADGFSSSRGVSPTNFAVDPQFRIGYAQNWQLSLQRDLPKALQMVVTYSGAKGTRAQQQVLPNTFPAGAVNPCLSCPNGFTYLSANGNSVRNGIQFQVRRRLRAGLSSEVQYTYSRSYDNSILAGGSIGGGPGARLAPGSRGYIAQNWLDLSAEHGRSLFDQRHVFSVSVQYTTGQGLRGAAFVNNWKGEALRDWTFATQINGGSGFPLTPTYLAATRGTGVTGTLRPDATGESVTDAPAGLYLNPRAFAIPKAGTWGNAARNSISGPNQFVMNASIGRTFQTTDRISLDFRIDASNVLNYVAFSSYVTTVNSAQFGLPTGANAMRAIQTTLRARF